MALMSQAEYAKHRGISKQAVSKAVQRGRISLVNGKVDSEVADAQWTSNTEHAQRMRQAQTNRESAAEAAARASQPSRTFSASRAVGEAFKARLLQLEYEEKSGSLVPAEAARQAAYNTGRRARDLLFALPDRVAAPLAMKKAEEIHRVLSEEVRRVCDEVSRWATI